jgi:tetratricopeptide (TPR) repeat protein
MNETQQVRTKRSETERAIQLALANRWEEAAQVNRAIIQQYPNDVDAYNRLGKALMELRQYKEAKKAYEKALELDKTNQIARKNLERIQTLLKSRQAQAETTAVDPKLFLEQTGKSAVTVLQKTAPEVVARLDAGDRVELKPSNGTLIVQTPTGEYVGELEPRLGLRLKKLMEGGNEYAAAIASLSKGECRVLIRETYQHPSQAGKPSFPTLTPSEGLRPYVKERLLRYETEVEEELTEEEEEPEITAEASEKEIWDDTELQEGDVRLYDAAAAEDVDDELEE